MYILSNFSCNQLCTQCAPTWTARGFKLLIHLNFILCGLNRQSDVQYSVMLITPTGLKDVLAHT